MLNIIVIANSSVTIITIIYIYIYIYHIICIYVCVYIYIYIYIYTHICVYVRMCVCIYIYIYMYVCMYVCMHVCISLSLSLYIYIYIGSPTSPPRAGTWARASSSPGLRSTGKNPTDQLRQKIRACDRECRYCYHYDYRVVNISTKANEFLGGFLRASCLVA